MPHISFRRLLTIAGTLAVMPALFAGFFYVREMAGSIAFSEKEREGVAVLRAIWPNIHALASNSAETAASQATAERIARLDDGGGLARSFQEVAAPTAQDGETRLHAYRAFLRDVADSSNLTLDPDLDTFYLMETATVSLPLSLGRLSILRRDGAGGDGLNQALALDEQADLIVTALRRAQKGAPRGAVGADLVEEATALQASTTRILETVRAERANSPSIAAAASAVPGLADAALQQSHALFGRSIDALDQGLARRIGALKGELLGAVALFVILVALVVLVGILAVLSVVRGASALAGALNAMARGDIDAAAPMATAKTELGDVARAVDALRLALTTSLAARHAAETEDALARQRESVVGGIATEIGRQIDTLVIDMNIACHELMSRVELVTNNAQDTQIHMVTTSERLDAARKNVEEVARAIGELTGSTREIAEQATASAAISDRARLATERVNRRLAELDEAMNTIHRMGDLISGIARKTNLLALNATIEAARAGEAGRGFAVVASEVKDLALQTAQATEEISGQITGIRSAKADVALEIDEVGRVIDDIIGLTGVIAAATEQQSVMTGNINFNIEETAGDSSAVADILKDVTAKSIETHEQSQDLHGIARGLSAKADEVERTIAQLVSDLKAA